MRSLATAALIAVLHLASANAEIITVEYEATLDANPDVGWPAGVVLTGSFTFDSEASPASGIGFGEVVYPVLGHTMTLNGGTSFVGFDDNGNGHGINLFHNSQFGDVYQVISDTTGNFNGSFDIASFGFLLQSSFGDALTSLALPLTKEQLDAFDVQQGFIDFLYSDSASGRLRISGLLTRLEVLGAPLAAACDGFAAPFDAAIGLSRREQRVIPLRMELFDEEGFALGPADITAPTVSVSYASGVGGGELEQLVESPGRATSGNSFVWDDLSQQWAFNLSTKPYTAVGTYTVTVAAGDEDYVLSPACSGTFARQ